MAIRAWQQWTGALRAEQRPSTAQADFGAQGGDPARAVTLDLSTCVNRYGPAPAALGALRAVQPAELLLHPYDAAHRLREAYARLLGVPAGELVASRAATEFIWAMGRALSPRQVAVPLPAYTDYLRVFPGRGFGPEGGAGHSIGQLDGALAAAKVVLISNPHNPTGTLIDRDELTWTAMAHPRSVLVVDESYLEFVPVPEAATMVGCAADNVVVLRSASKFYGIAATRAGVAWCRDRELLDGLIGDQETWGLSGVDVTVATAALASRDWAAQVRQRLLADSRWLADALRVLPDVRVRANHNVHFQYALSDRPRSVADALAAAGVGVRALGRAHGVRPGAVRVVAPREDERDQVSAAFAAVAEGTSDAAVAITVAS